MPYCLGKMLWSKNSRLSILNIKKLKDKSVTKVFLTGFHKVKLNPDIIIQENKNLRSFFNI